MLELQIATGYTPGYSSGGVSHAPSPYSKTPSSVGSGNFVSIPYTDTPESTAAGHYLSTGEQTTAPSLGSETQRTAQAYYTPQQTKSLSNLFKGSGGEMRKQQYEVEARRQAGIRAAQSSDIASYEPGGYSKVEFERISVPSQLPKKPMGTVSRADTTRESITKLGPLHYVVEKAKGVGTQLGLSSSGKYGFLFPKGTAAYRPDQTGELFGGATFGAVTISPVASVLYATESFSKPYWLKGMKETQRNIAEQGGNTLMSNVKGAAAGYGPDLAIGVLPLFGKSGLYKQSSKFMKNIDTAAKSIPEESASFFYGERREGSKGGVDIIWGLSGRAGEGFSTTKIVQPFMITPKGKVILEGGKGGTFHLQDKKLGVTIFESGGYGKETSVSPIIKRDIANPEFIKQAKGKKPIVEDIFNLERGRINKKSDKIIYSQTPENIMGGTGRVNIAKRLSGEFDLGIKKGGNVFVAKGKITKEPGFQSELIRINERYKPIGDIFDLNIKQAKTRDTVFKTVNRNKISKPYLAATREEGDIIQIISAEPSRIKMKDIVNDVVGIQGSPNVFGRMKKVPFNFESDAVSSMVYKGKKSSKPYSLDLMGNKPVEIIKKDIKSPAKVISLSKEKPSSSSVAYIPSLVESALSIGKSAEVINPVFEFSSPMAKLRNFEGLGRNDRIFVNGIEPTELKGKTRDSFVYATDIKNKQDFKFNQRLDNRGIFGGTISTVNIFDNSQEKFRERTIDKLKFRTAAEEKTRLRQKFTYKSILGNENARKIPGIFNMGGGSSESKSKMMASIIRKLPGYNVFIGIKKKKLLAANLPREEALWLGQKYAAENIAASFSTSESGGTAISKGYGKANLISGMFRPSKTTAGFYVEKPKYRLDIMGEKKQIKSAKKSKGRFKWL